MVSAGLCENYLSHSPVSSGVSAEFYPQISICLLVPRLSLGSIYYISLQALSTFASLFFSFFFSRFLGFFFFFWLFA